MGILTQEKAKKFLEAYAYKGTSQKRKFALYKIILT